MDDAPPPAPSFRPEPSHGRLSRADALTLLEDGRTSLAAGDFRDAVARFSRVVGFDDAEVTGSALLGLGEARYRLDDDAAALASWEMAVKLPENPATYAAWRNVAAARVRAGDLGGALDAYREADRRAPLEDKPEIANRLGWLSKEQGDTGAARRYFARGRGDSGLVLATGIVAITVLISLWALLSRDAAEVLFPLLQLDKAAVAAGEWWRLFSVTLVHGSLLHLGFNMYALYLTGPIVERWYGSGRFLIFYLACAAAGSVASFVFGSDLPSVGASGAIFGLFGILFVAGRLHHPVDRQGRMLVRQLGMLIVINVAFGFAVPGIDNAAHLGGLAAGALLGAMIPPNRVQTMTSLWQRAEDAGRTRLARVPVFVPFLALGIVAAVVLIGLVVGTSMRTA
jgi:membrane associated rhomboid family serine protease